MKGLFADTSGKESFIAISNGSTFLKNHFFESTNDLFSELLPIFEEVNKKELDFIAIGVGPGSYTGTRSALAMGQSLAYALKIPLYTFPSPLAKCRLKDGHLIFIEGSASEQRFLLEGTTKNGRFETLSLHPKVELSEIANFIKEKTVVFSSTPLATIPTIPPDRSLEYALAFIEEKMAKDPNSEIFSAKILYLR